MLTKTISSLQHPSILRWVELVKNRASREENGSVVVCGEKLVRELSARLPLKCFITTEEKVILPAEEKVLVTEGMLKKITGLQNPDGYAAEILLPPPQDLSSCRKLLILDRISDPGNLGTLLRSAYALGWEGVVATPGSVDFFNDKALRAAKGATFYLPYAWASPEEIASWGHALFIADIQGDPIAKHRFQTPLALILGNEAKGPSCWKKGTKIHIPMRKGAESLNVAAAGAILLYAMGQQ